MNKLYIDQITKYMNSARAELKEMYDDVAMATGALRWMIRRLENELENCINVEQGKCETWWRHDDCLRLMNILYDLTGDEKYTVKSTIGSSWD